MTRQYAKIAVAACLIMSAMIAGTVSFGFFMEPVTANLGFERAAFSLYFSLITAVGTATLPLYGKLIRKFGARPFVIGGGVWTAVSMASLSLCSNLPAFYFVGCLIGIGFFGCSYATVPVIISSYFPEKSGSLMGLAAACGGIAAVLASLVFPPFILSFGWRKGYLLLGIFVFIFIVPTGAFLLKSHSENDGGSSSETGSEPTSEELSGMPYRIALHSPYFWVTTLVFLILAMTVAVTQHLPAYFVSVGFDSITAGIFMSVISAGIVMTNPLSGIISDRVGTMKAFAFCSVLYCASFILLPISNAFFPICFTLILMSLGNANTSIFAPVITSSFFGKRDYASIWGFVSMACVLGQAIGTPLWGLIYDSTGGYELGMYASGIVTIISLGILLKTSRALADVRR